MADSASSFAAKIGGRTGSLVSITGSDPAANVEASYTVPNGQMLELHSYKIGLVSDANVATRTVNLVIKNEVGTVVWQISAGVTQAASLTYVYTFNAGLGYTQSAISGANTVATGLPEKVLLPAGWKVETSTTNRQVTDNFDAPLLTGILYT